MKKTLTLLIFIVFVFGISAQEVPNVQYSMLTKITATWCTFCGTWGWDAFEKLLPENEGKAIIISNHYSGDLRNNTAAAIASNLNTFGQPLFYVNNTNQNFSSNNWTSKTEDTKKMIEDNYKASPIVNAGIMASLNGNTLNVKTKTRFFKSAEGEFYLGVYVIEDKVVNYQASRSSAAVHKNVLRGSVGPEHFGKLISSGQVASGTEMENEFTTTLNASWNTDNIKLATIIWRKVGDSYLYFNGYVFDEWQTTTSIKNNSIEGFKVDLNNLIAHEDLVFVISIEKPIKDLSIKLYDIQGNLLSSKSYTGLNAGIHHEEWDTNFMPSGSYLLQFHSPNGSLIKRFILQ